jgi:hypothetical protein
MCCCSGTPFPERQGQAANYSGSWWSTPIGANAATSRRIDQLPAVQLNLVEDHQGWRQARVAPVRVEPNRRVHEIAGPFDWIDLVDRYPDHRHRRSPARLEPRRAGAVIGTNPAECVSPGRPLPGQRPVPQDRRPTERGLVTPLPPPYLRSMMLPEGEVPVDSDLVRDLLRRQQPDLADLPVTPLGGGTDNTMYRVGADHVARFPRTPEKVGPLKKELAWLPRLGPHLPCLIRAPTYRGRTYRGRPAPGYPFRRALFTWIDGEEVAAASVTDWARYGGDLADVVRGLHATDLMGATRSGELCW